MSHSLNDYEHSSNNEVQELITFDATDIACQKKRKNFETATYISIRSSQLQIMSSNKKNGDARTDENVSGTQVKTQ